jgi:pimeloyl-ACP methyl ester carboxylesterase
VALVLPQQAAEDLDRLGKTDPFFTVEGAKAYLRDIPKAELNLPDTGHFALEDSCDFIAQKIVNFFS